MIHLNFCVILDTYIRGCVRPMTHPCNNNPYRSMTETGPIFLFSVFFEKSKTSHMFPAHNKGYYRGGSSNLKRNSVCVHIRASQGLWNTPSQVCNIILCVFCTLRLVLMFTQMKCTYNANDSTHITLFFQNQILVGSN